MEGHEELLIAIEEPQGLLLSLEGPEGRLLVIEGDQMSCKHELLKIIVRAKSPVNLLLSNIFSKDSPPSKRRKYSRINQSLSD